MKLTEEQSKELRESFEQVKQVSDLVFLINAIIRNIYQNGEKIQITEKDFTYYANPKLSLQRRYTSFIIPKKSGGERIILAPNPTLKFILRALNLIFQSYYHPPKGVTGFVTGSSVVDNARLHIASRYVYNIDLKDFFHSFERKRIKGLLMHPPFHLSDNEKLAFLIASAVTHPIEINGETRYVLPQGSPASPVLTNLMSRTLDRRLNGLAKRFGIKYSRYADDITFSSQHNVYRKKAFLEELHRIIEGQGFQINEKKTRLQYHAYRQEVTGVVVNQKTNVARKYIKRLRLWLFILEKYLSQTSSRERALELAKKDFSRIYLKDKEYKTTNVPDMEKVIRGQLAYLKMIKGETDPVYRKLITRFEKIFPPSLDIIVDQISEQITKLKTMKKVPVIRLDQKNDSNTLYAVQLLEHYPKVWIAVPDFRNHSDFIGKFYRFEKPVPANEYWVGKSVLGRRNILKKSPFEFIGELELLEPILCNFCAEQRQNKKGIFYVLKPVSTPHEDCAKISDADRLYSVDEIKKLMQNGKSDPWEQLKNNCNAK